MLNVKRKKSSNFFFLVAVFGFFYLISDFLINRRELVENYGISFSLNGNIFLFLNFFFILFLTWYWYRQINFELGLSLVLVGGWINMINRLKFGFVPDYWDFFGFYNNLADWVIGIGVLIFFIELLCKKKLK